MKKFVLFVLTIVVLATILYSCKSTENCPAYGEKQKFQLEQEY